MSLQDLASARHTPPPPTLADPAEFRDALSKLASGVAVVSCWHGAEPKGLLVSSLTGLSAEPPRLLFCVQKTASAHDALLEATFVGLSILDQEDATEARRFSGRDLAHERFDPTDWVLDRRRPPRLRRALTHLAGSVACRMDAGTHSVFVLDVHQVVARLGRPLIYFDRGFQVLSDR